MEGFWRADWILVDGSNAEETRGGRSRILSRDVIDMNHGGDGRSRSCNEDGSSAGTRKRGGNFRAQVVKTGILR